MATLVFGEDVVVDFGVPLLPLLLLESLPCLFLILEQNDFKLKSSDLKLMILELRFIDFFAAGCEDVGVGCGPTVSVATFSTGL